MKLYRPLAIFLSLSVLLSACDISIDLGSTPVVDANSIAAAQTVQAVLSAVPQSSPTAGLPVVALPTPMASLAPGVAIDGTTAEPGPGCNDSATHTAWTFDGKIYDVKIVNTPLAPNKKFIMAWTIQNTGSCTWDEGYKMSLSSGPQLGESANYPLLQPGQTLSLGQSVTLSIQMTAPSATGEYKSEWSLLNTKGEALLNFGVPIKVGVPQSGSLARPGDLRYTYDCSGGPLNISLYWVDAANNESGYRIYRNGTQIAELAAGSTSYSEYAPGFSNYEYTVAPFNASGESPARVTVYPTYCQ